MLMKHLISLAVNLELMLKGKNTIFLIEHSFQIVK
jgi:hypothetical protein